MSIDLRPMQVYLSVVTPFTLARDPFGRLVRIRTPYRKGRVKDAVRVSVRESFAQAREDMKRVTRAAGFCKQLSARVDSIGKDGKPRTAVLNNGMRIRIR